MTIWKTSTSKNKYMSQAEISKRLVVYWFIINRADREKWLTINSNHYWAFIIRVSSLLQLVSRPGHVFGRLGRINHRLIYGWCAEMARVPKRNNFTWCAPSDYRKCSPVMYRTVSALRNGNHTSRSAAEKPHVICHPASVVKSCIAVVERKNERMNAVPNEWMNEWMNTK